ncbi:MAG: CopD family protein [Gammaproteobacteria bacterium]|nr:CopD family protein [Gammaproteobacteria bacterium]MBU2478555.1 CopD family protein [Gammaproteobacteria bacterium]
MPVLIALHLLAAVVWVGGMFFAYMALRPVAATLLEPPQRLPLWTQTFVRFFPWVWLSILLLTATGYLMVLGVFGGMGAVGLHVHLMQGLGWIMILMYMHMYFAPFQRMKRAVAAGDWPTGGQQLAQIRRIVGINLILGLLVAVIASGGRYLAL